MGVASVSLLVDSPLEEVRHMAHEALDTWVDELAPLFAQEITPQLSELSDHFQKTRFGLLGACMKAVVEKLYAPYLSQRWAGCPRCGRTLCRKRLDQREVSTLHGSFAIERPYFYCQQCRHGFHPLDEALALAPDYHQYDIQKRATAAAAKMPFAESAEHFEDLTGVVVGNHFSHETLNAVGEAATLEVVIPERDEIERRISQAMGPSRTPPVLVVAADGAMMPTRPKAHRKAKRGKGRYQEVKGFRLYLLSADDQIMPLASWHQVQDAQRFHEDLALVAKRIDRDKVRTALVGDGASWLWNAMVACFPQGRQILDFYHCAEHVHTVARAQYGEGTLAGQQWAEATLVRLCTAEVKTVLGALRRSRPRNKEAQEEILKLISYLENNSHRIDYLSNLKQGFPIGSGGIESANKFICHTRMKRSGAWWVVASGNAMLRVRCAIYNGTFHRVFDHYIKRRSENLSEDK